MRSNPKTVYVLGAGFSRDAGLPLQAQILPRIVAFKPDLPLLEAPLHYAYLEDFWSCRNSLLGLLRETFPSSITTPGSSFPRRELPPLEDVFTLLDHTISRRQGCRAFSWQALEAAREALKRTILFVVHAASERAEPRPMDCYRRFAAHLLETRIRSGQPADPFSIVSLNWDCILEESIYWCLQKIGAIKKADIDYCCYTTPLGPGCWHTPSVLQKSKGLFNLKVMKLHGSANWLLCPNCNRLYTGLGAEADAWELYMRPRACPSCLQAAPHQEGVVHPQLDPFFITPTFLKVFDNPHIQMTWHNAYVEISEASELVFIGYSFPEADYHFRTFLRRAVRPDARITAVLTDSDRPKRNTPRRLLSAFAATRYLKFFGARTRFEFGGVRAYFTTLLGSVPLSARLNRLRRRLA